MGHSSVQIDCKIVDLFETPEIPFGYEFKDGNLIHQTAQINWEYLDIGVGNKIGPFCVIGADAQHRHYASQGRVAIGNHNIFHSNVSISRPTKFSDLNHIGDRCFFMTSTVVHHDCFIEDDVTTSSNVSIAGNVIIMRGANIGMNAAVHQFKTVGSFSMIGMNACVIRRSNIRPGRKYAGVPVRDIGKNSIGLSRAKINEKSLKKELERFGDYKELLKNRSQ